MSNLAYILNEKADNPASQAAQELPDNLKDKIIKSIEKNPMNAFCVNIFCTAVGVKTPYEAFGENHTIDADDIGIVIGTALGCVPTIGPLLYSVFSIFWKRATPNDNVTAEQLEKALKDLKKEILEIVEKMVDKKIEKSEIEIYKTLVFNNFQGVAESCELLFEYITALKYKLKHKEVIRGGFLEGLRTRFELVRDKLRSIMYFLMDPKFGKYLIPYLIEVLFSYTLVMRTMDTYFFQFGIDPVFVAGRPATDETPALPSYLERLDKKMETAMKFICENTSKPEEISKLNSLLLSNGLLYPCHTILYPFSTIPPMNSPLFPLHKVQFRRDSDSKIADGPFIFRYDACGMSNGPQEIKERLIRVLPERERVTGCRGTFLHYVSPNIEFEFERKVDVQVRLFGIYPKNDFKLEILINGDREVYDAIHKPYPCEIFREFVPNSKYTSARKYNEAMLFDGNIKINSNFYSSEKNIGSVVSGFPSGYYSFAGKNVPADQKYYSGYCMIPKIYKDIQRMKLDISQVRVECGFAKLLFIELIFVKNCKQ